MMVIIESTDLPLVTVQTCGKSFRRDAKNSASLQCINLSSPSSTKSKGVMESFPESGHSAGALDLLRYLTNIKCLPYHS
jgi:hypothetical protein